ncbi:MAG: hypothetical protein RJB39_302 [Candidatus Parcubacteria bacterium]|jgi:competence protein ComEC
MKNLLYKYNSVLIIALILAISTGIMGYTLYLNNGCRHSNPAVNFLDVGQGDAIYIRDNLGKTLLIDTGPKDGDIFAQIQNVTMCPKVHIDQLLLTHPDADHIGEAEHLILKGLVGNVLQNGFMDVDQPDESATENRLEALTIPRTHIAAGDTIYMNDISIQILYPEGEPYLTTLSTTTKKKPKRLDDNNFSIVVKIIATTTAGVKTFLLTGDAPIKVENELIKKYCPQKDVCWPLRSNILKLGHHGSRNSSSEQFLDLVSPDEVVISAGKDNSYHHPHEETMQRVYDQRRKKPLLIRETFREGNILYKLD